MCTVATAVREELLVWRRTTLDRTNFPLNGICCTSEKVRCLLPLLLTYMHRAYLAIRSLQLLSYTSDVLIAGANFSAGSPDRTMDGQVSSSPPASKASAATATAIPASHHRHLHDLGSSSSTYLHVVDRLRTLRTWLLHPGGATTVAAYSLPAAVPRVPKYRTPSSKLRNAALQPQQDSTRDGDHRADSSTPRAVVGPKPPSSHSTVSVLSPGGGGGDGGRQEQKRGVAPGKSQSVVADNHEDDKEEEEEGEEEEVDARRLPVGALIAAVLPSRLQGPNASSGPGILIAAGVTLSGVSFLSAGREWGEEHHSLLWKSNAEEAGFDGGSGAGDGREFGGDELMPPRVLGMQGVVPSNGNQQAVALVWAERPSFQVLDVSRGGSAVIVEEVLLSRRHR